MISFVEMELYVFVFVLLLLRLLHVVTDGCGASRGVTPHLTSLLNININTNINTKTPSSSTTVQLYT